MGTKDLTHEALAKALTDGEPMTHEQRGLLLGLVADDKVWQRECDRQMVQIHGLMFDALGEPRTRYVRVTLDGSHCVMHPTEGDRYVQDARGADDDNADRYEVRDVYLSEREFDDLPEFDGF